MVVLLSILATSVQAAESGDVFEKNKSQFVLMLQAKHQNDQKTLDCVQSAKNNEEIKICRDQMRIDREKLKEVMEGKSVSPSVR